VVSRTDILKEVPAMGATIVKLRWRAPCGPPEACPRARARDERVADSDERIGWGGCG